MTTLPDGYKPLIDAVYEELLSLCSGRTGDSEAETALTYRNGDCFYRFSTGKGADAAAILRRNPGAILGWKLWQYDETDFTLFFLLDPAEVRGPGLWIKPARTEEQRAAQAERGRQLAGVSS